MQKRLKWRLIAPLAALGGGVLGVFGAVIQEVFYGSLFAAFVAGPMIEETMKPAGVYILYALQRDSVGGRWYRALLAALGGLSLLPGTRPVPPAVSLYLDAGDAPHRELHSRPRHQRETSALCQGRSSVSQRKLSVFRDTDDTAQPV
jgi:hypothetical protein